MSSTIQQKHKNPKNSDPLWTYNMCRMYNPITRFFIRSILSLSNRSKGKVNELYKGFSSEETFPINAALLGLVPDQDQDKDQQYQNCGQHNSKPLDYYCLKCHQVICADCFIFGDHQEHKLSKKKELKDLNGYLITKLDKVYYSNRMFRALKDYESVEQFLNNQAKDKLQKIKKKTSRKFDVGY